MPTAGAEVSEKELQAIVEYANQCGETVSNLMRKIVIADATFLNCGFLNDNHSEYEHSMSIPTGISDTPEEDKFTEASGNKIRGILGWSRIKLV